MSCQLYRHFNAKGELLYVGVSLSAISRLISHKRSAWAKEITRVEIENCGSREEAEKRERLAIRTEKPKYNVSGGINLIQYDRKRGRPRIGEDRDMPWLTCVPKMSKSTYYRRLNESK